MIPEVEKTAYLKGKRTCLFQVDGRPLPKLRTNFLGGEMTISDLHKSDHGVYECVVSNDVATIVARTALLIERTTPHAPTNVTVTSSETFAVTIEWLPGYSGCSSCVQTYKIRFVWHTQCGNFRIFMSFRFCVKSIRGNLKVLKLAFLPFLGPLTFVNLVNFSLQKVQKITKIKTQSH